MKNKFLWYALLAGGVYLLIAAKRKPRYSIEVPAPEKITEDQFYGRKSLIDRLRPIAQKAKPVVKKIAKNIKEKKVAKKKVGFFPDTI